MFPAICYYSQVVVVKRTILIAPYVQPLFPLMYLLRPAIVVITVRGAGTGPVRLMRAVATYGLWFAGLLTSLFHLLTAE